MCLTLWARSKHTQGPVRKKKKKKELNVCSFTELVLIFRVRLSSPRLAWLVTALIWILQVTSEASVTPWYLMWSTSWRASLHGQYCLKCLFFWMSSRGKFGKRMKAQITSVLPHKALVKVFLEYFLIFFCRVKAFTDAVISEQSGVRVCLLGQVVDAQKEQRRANNRALWHAWFDRGVAQLPVTTFTYPITVGVVGAPHITSQPVFSNFIFPPVPSGTWLTSGLSIHGCCFPTFSPVCLVFFFFNCGVQDGFGLT